MKKLTMLLVLVGGLLCAGFTGMEIGLTPEMVMGFFGDALSKQVTQFTIAFGIAAWIHSGRVKKEIAAQCVSIVSSVDGVAQALRQDLMKQSDRIGGVVADIGLIKTSVTGIAARVEVLEKQKQVPIMGENKGVSI